MSEKKQEVISKIKQIIKDEKFKIDAFFFCGFPGGTPNEALKKVCEQYLETAESGKTDAEVVQNLIAELQNAVSKLQTEQNGTLMNNMDDVKFILENKEYL